MNSKITHYYEPLKQQIILLFQSYLHTNQPISTIKIRNSQPYYLWEDVYIIYHVYIHVILYHNDLRITLKHCSQILARSTNNIYTRLCKLIRKTTILELLFNIRNQNQYLECSLLFDTFEASPQFYFRREHFKDNSNKFKQSLMMVDRIEEDYSEDIQDVTRKRIGIKLQKKTRKKKEVGWQEQEDNTLMTMNSQGIQLIFFRKGLRHTLLRCDELGLKEHHKWVMKKWKQYQCLNDQY